MVTYGSSGVDWPKSHDDRPLALLPEACLGESFLQDISTAAHYFGRLQASVIERNLRLFDHFSQADGQAVHKARQLIVKEWIRRFRINRIEVCLPPLFPSSLLFLAYTCNLNKAPTLDGSVRAEFQCGT
jgi:hypothetical protein